MADLWRRTHGSKKGNIQTSFEQETSVKKTTPENFGNLGKTKKKLLGFPETTVEKFEELFYISSELFSECVQFAKRNTSAPFPELEAEAIALVQKKHSVESSIDELFQEYMGKNFSGNPKGFILKRESKLIIERAQRSIETCRPLMHEVKRMRSHFRDESNTTRVDEIDLGDDLYSF